MSSRRTVRTGCQRCKDRRTTCDEKRPACQNCLDGNIECPGYTKPIRWSRKHERLCPSDAQGQRGNIGQRRKHHASQSVQSSLDAEPAPSEQSNVSQNPAAAWPAAAEGNIRLDLGLDAFTTGRDWRDLGPGEFDQLVLGGTSVQPDPDAPSVNPQYPAFAHGFTIGHDALRFTSSFLPGPNDVAQLESPSSEQNNGSLLPSPHAHTMSSPDRGGSEVRETTTASTKNNESSFLHTFYRLSFSGRVPGLSDTDFVSYFFSNVCRVLSCYDSAMNPFRKLVFNKWTTSLTLSLTIQSMAVGHLSNWYPYMTPLGIQKRTQAWQSLQRDLRLYRTGQVQLETALLSLVLLGFSSAWHNSSHVGLQYLYISRDLMQARLQILSFFPGSNAMPETDFYTDAVLHWEMLASFIDPVPITPFHGHGMPRLTIPQKPRPIMPHPCTGVANELHFALAEIGRVLRRQRASAMVASPQSIQDPTMNAQDRRWTVMLETFLKDVQIPSAEDIDDCGDPNTPKMHLIHAAEAYRYIGLLEIYRLYPDLIAESSTTVASDMDQSHQFELPSSDPRLSYASLTDTMTASLAIRVLDIFEALPLSSGTCRLQPLLLLSAASQLRFGESGPSSTAISDDHQECIIHYRYFAEHRILALSRKMPQKPLLRLMDIMKEVWSRLDGGEDDTHWMDVIDENGWQTLMT